MADARLAADDLTPPPVNPQPQSHGQPVAVVLVHGWNGDAVKTWLWRPSLFHAGQPVHLASLINTLGHPIEVRSFAHSSGPLSEAGLEQVAISLKTFLEDEFELDRQFILVGHSLGGLLCRQLAVEALEKSPPLASRILGILLLGCPNLGVQVISAAHSASVVLSVFSSMKGFLIGSVLGSGLRRLLRRGATSQLATLSSFLGSLNTRWQDHLLRPEVSGRPPILCQAVAGERDLIVPFTSAVALTSFGATHSINKGHIALAKARDISDSTFLRVRHFIRDALAAHRDWPRERARVQLVGGTRDAIGRVEKRWVRTERELIDIDLPQIGQTCAAPSSHALSCTVTNTRTGQILPRELKVAATLEARDESLGDLYYRFVLGRGLLDEFKQAALAEFIELPGASSGQSDSFQVSVEAAQQRGRPVRYDLDLQQCFLAPSYVLLTFVTTDELEPECRDTSLTLKIKSRVLMGQAWYVFFLTRLVTDQLRVEVCSPFKVGTLTRSWTWSPEVYENRARGGKFVSTVISNGPILPGQCCYWVFQRE